VTPLSMLCEIIALGGKVAASPYRGGSSLATLLRNEFLREAGVLASIVCDACETMHSAAVRYDEGRYGYDCPDLGFVALDHADIEAVRSYPGRLVEHLSDALGCKRRKHSPVTGQTWRIGALETNAGEVMLYFHPKLHSEEDIRQLTDALSREVRARWRLIITAAGIMPLADAQAIQLDDLVEMDAETGALRILVEPAELFGIPRKDKGGRPDEHGNLLKPLIESRIHMGTSAEAVNAEARAVLATFQTTYPEKPEPSDSTIKRYIRKARGGS
jgi:hypothetical protein